MKKIDWKKILPHVYAIGVFFIVAVIYCLPALQGKVLQQSDVIHWKGMAQSLFEYKETHGHFPLWTNSMFGGMPAYQIAIEPYNPLSVVVLHKVFMLFLPKPIGFFFLLCVSFYFLSQVIRVKPWLGVLGAIAYAYSTFSCVIVAVGHETQMQALGYVPALLASLFILYDKKYLLGGALTALFSALLIAMNHLQITYYFLIIAAFATIAYAIRWIKAKEYKHLALALSIAVVAGGVGALTNMVVLATTWDYSKATMRNGTLNLDTTSGGAKKSAGLPIDYAFGWSYGKAETFTLIVPGIYGGSNSGELKGNSKLAEHAIEKGVPEDQAVQFASQFPTYWGAQPFTSGPVYLGAIICFLFILGAIYVEWWQKWWIISVCILALLMSWGKNFEAFNSFLFNYLPFYNKFRVPTMTLVIPQVLFPLLGIMTLQQFLFEEKNKAEAIKKLKLAGYVTAGIVAILAFMYVSFDYRGTNDETSLNYFRQLAQGNEQEAKGFYSALLEDRKSLFGGDLLRSIIFIAGAFALLWMVAKNKMKPVYALMAILVLSSFDLLQVGRRYFNENNFQDQETFDESNFAPSPADISIKKDTSYYRVLNLTQDVFNDAITSYHHNSIGGYHPAKLSIVEDLLNFQLRNKQPMNMQVLNMLNTKYVITADKQSGKTIAQTNPDALGPVWFVKGIRYVNTPAEAMKALDNFNPKDTAIVVTDSKNKIPFAPQPDSSASIRLIKNDNDYIEYQSNSATNQFAVFSEIYYDRGWKAYIDGKETPIVQTNYVLRGLAVPAGQHKITFEFKPASYYASGKITIVASFLIWLALIAAIVKNYLPKGKQTATV
jgi:hypothetical protein